MGRFGGGWDWAMGFQAGGRTLLLNLLILPHEALQMTEAVTADEVRQVAVALFDLRSEALAEIRPL